MWLHYVLWRLLCSAVDLPSALYLCFYSFSVAIFLMLETSFHCLYECAFAWMFSFVVLVKCFLFVAATFFYCHFLLFLVHFFFMFDDERDMTTLFFFVCPFFFVFLIYDEQYTILLTWHSKNNKKRWESSFHRLTWSLNRKNIVRRNLSSMRTHTENPAFHTILCSNCCFEWICAFRWSKTGTSKYFS